jgi:hypothetical protein
MCRLTDLCDRQDALSVQMQEDYKNQNLGGKALRTRLVVYQRLFFKSTLAFREAIALSNATDKNNEDITLPLEVMG